MCIPLICLCNSWRSESQSSIPSRPRKRLESFEAAYNAGNLRKVQVLLQPPRCISGKHRSCKPSSIPLYFLSHAFFFFCVHECVRQGRYDVALRDYKKGKFLLDSRPGQLLPLPSSSGSSAKEVEAQQRRVLDKVWANVEKAMGEMRNVLVGMLRDEARSVEEQERTIE
jgi:hypothetical protein